jgi:hypothetical protein
MSLSQGDDSGERLTLRWVFVRGEARIEVCRPVAPTSTQVEVTGGDGELKTFNFADRPALVAFHAGFEQALLQTGWRLAEFAPQRRSGADRRAIPRDGDRRGSLALVWPR